MHLRKRIKKIFERRREGKKQIVALIIISITLLSVIAPATSQVWHFILHFIFKHFHIKLFSVHYHNNRSVEHFQPYLNPEGNPAVANFYEKTTTCHSSLINGSFKYEKSPINPYAVSFNATYLLRRLWSQGSSGKLQPEYVYVIVHGVWVIEPLDDKELINGLFPLSPNRALNNVEMESFSLSEKIEKILSCRSTGCALITQPPGNKQVYVSFVMDFAPPVYHEFLEFPRKG